MNKVYTFLRGISSGVRGNAKALSAVIVVGACIFITVLLVKPDLNLLAGALIGAAVSIVAASLIEFLEAPWRHKIPDQFIRGAQREVDTIGYYRENQEVHIEFIDFASEKKIKMIFNSRLVPIRDHDLRINYPKIKAPPGLTKLDTTYMIAGEVVPPDSQPHLKGPEEECLSVEYKVEHERSEYGDEHIWLSPVLRYDVYFKIPNEFECNVFEQIGEDNIPVKRSRRLGLVEKHYPQPYPAFSRQGFKWKIVRANETAKRAQTCVA
jgi:hypothetical protein